MTGGLARVIHLARLLAIALVLLLPALAAAQTGWTEVITDVSGPTASGAPVVAVDAEGNALVAWNAESGVQAARYARASGTWSGPVTVLSQNYGALSLSINGRGDAVLASGLSQPWDVGWVEAAVYTAETATWGSPTEIAYWGMLVGAVIDQHGNGAVVWVDRVGMVDIIKTATYGRAAAAWNRAADVPNASLNSSIRLVLDSNDSAILVWDDMGGVTRVARYIPSAGAWSQPFALAGRGLANIAVDRSGNATVMWTRIDGATATIEASHYAAAAGTWSALSGASIGAPGALAITAPAVASDEAGNTIAVWEWFDGLQWTVQSATYRAFINSWTVIQQLRMPENESRRSASPQVGVDASGSTTVVWSDYSLSSVESARRGPDGNWAMKTLAASASHSPALAVDGTGNVVVAWAWTTGDPGAFTATVRSTRWQASTEPPSAPAGLVGFADGTTATLTWENTLDGGAPTGIVLDVTGAHVGSFPLPLSERFTLPGVPPGTYTVSVRAVNAFGRSERSNSVTLTFPGCVIPGMPAHFSVTTFIDPWEGGGYITASWSRPSSGTPPLDYLVDVTGSFVGSFSTGALPSVGGFYSATYGFYSGTYSVSVRARSACGVSAPTPPQTVTIP
jgi:hypothetical protein